MERMGDLQDYTVSVAGSFAEAESLRQDWERLLAGEESPVFDSDPDRYAAVVGSQTDAQPRLLLLRKGEEPVAMVLGRIQTLRFPCAIGYKSFSLPPLKCLDIKHGWCFGQITEETAQVLLREIRTMLNSSQAEVVRFQDLNTDSPIYKAVLAQNRGPRCRFRGRVETHRAMRVPESLEAFYKSCSAGHRMTLRRCVRKIERRYGSRAVVARYSDEAGVDQFGKLAEQVSMKTYQHGLGSGLVYDERTQFLLRRIAARGWMRGHILLLDGEPCAFQYGVIYRGQYFLELLGFDPKWKDLRVGTYLFLQVLQDLCRPDSGAQVIDFGSGDAEYKTRYGTDAWQESFLFVFAPRLYPASVNMLRTCITELNVAMQFVVSKMGIINWLKRRWRDRLQEPAGEEGR
jgi:hypothetical protein